ncbi:flavin reductase family protein [Streptomyces sp. NPDC015125]|uniref:flavin reductase family protein n=1 Tax=Streptomyces sp. NPDC015125 TaxID=3364938 RepID=UPI0036F6AEA6
MTTVAPTVGAGRLCTALRGHASGVAVLTAATPSGAAGVTITSFTSVSAEPARPSMCRMRRRRPAGWTVTSSVSSVGWPR